MNNIFKYDSKSTSCISYFLTRFSLHTFRSFQNCVQKRTNENNAEEKNWYLPFTCQCERRICYYCSINVYVYNFCLYSNFILFDIVLTSNQGTNRQKYKCKIHQNCYFVSNYTNGVFPIEYVLVYIHFVLHIKTGPRANKTMPVWKLRKKIRGTAMLFNWNRITWFMIFLVYQSLFPNECQKANKQKQKKRYKKKKNERRTRIINPWSATVVPMLLWLSSSHPRTLVCCLVLAKKKSQHPSPINRPPWGKASTFIPCQAATHSLLDICIMPCYV